MKITRIHAASLTLFIILYSGILKASSQSEEFLPVKSLSEFAMQMKQYTNKLQSIQCDFSQKKQLQYLDASLESSGKFWFESPDKVRWEYQIPYSYTLVINQGKLTMKSDNTSSQFDMQSNDIFKQVNNLIMASVSGDIFNDENYRIKAFENKNSYMVQMEPESEYISDLIQKMELYFDKKTYTVVKIKMIESGSDYSEISFSKQLLNEAIQENIFIP